MAKTLFRVAVAIFGGHLFGARWTEENTVLALKQTTRAAVARSRLLLVRGSACNVEGDALETASMSSSSGPGGPGAANMWGPVLMFAYHLVAVASFSQFCDAQCLARLSQTCHFGMLLKPTPRGSIEQFF